ncbi:hypothetical protein PENTCL1PPCAC_29103, partial [Pristionchus entomophagus]
NQMITDFVGVKLADSSGMDYTAMDSANYSPEDTKSAAASEPEIGSQSLNPQPDFAYVKCPESFPTDCCLLRHMPDHGGSIGSRKMS